MFTLFSVSVGQRFFTYVFFLCADIMTKEAPRSGSTMVAFRTKALEKGKGKGSLEMVVASNPSATWASGPSTANGSKKRKRKKSSNIANTTRLPGGTLRHPQPPYPICLESSSPIDATGPATVVVPTPGAPSLPWFYLGLIYNLQEVFRSVFR